VISTSTRSSHSGISAISVQSSGSGAMLSKRSKKGSSTKVTLEDIDQSTIELAILAKNVIRGSVATEDTFPPQNSSARYIFWWTLISEAVRISQNPAIHQTLQGLGLGSSIKKNVLIYVHDFICCEIILTAF